MASILVGLRDALQFLPAIRGPDADNEAAIDVVAHLEWGADGELNRGFVGHGYRTPSTCAIGTR
jgi:hypothetical protein